VKHKSALVTAVGGGYGCFSRKNLCAFVMGRATRKYLTATDPEVANRTWARTSGTSCAVACHAESERLFVPLGRLWRGLFGFELTLKS